MRALGAVGAAFAVLHTALAYGATVQTVVIDGQPIPGHPGQTFSIFGTPSIDKAGHVVFSGTARSGSTVLGDGQWLWRGGSDIVTIMMSGDPAPGLGAGISYFSAIQTQANGSDRIYLQARINETFVDPTKNVG